MENSPDIYQALSWDRMHAYHGGLFSDHLWVEFKEIAKNLPREIKRESSVIIDQQ